MKPNANLTRTLCGLALTFTASSCTKKATSEDASAPPKVTVVETTTPESAEITSETKTAETVPANTEDFVAASNALGMDLYRLEAKKPGNLLFSAPSIEVAFAMTYAGAQGETAEQMRTALHLPEGNEIHDSASAMLAAWNTPNEDYQLRVVNRLFGEKSYTFLAPFLERVKNSYAAPLESLDFQGQPDQQRKHINSWVMEQTESRIEDLLPEDSIQGDTRLVLVNAIYFLGTWTKTFDPARTSPQPFLVNGKKSVKVPMMAQTSHFNYGEGKGFKVLEMPYKGDDLAMTIVLPDDAKGLAAVEAQMNAENMSSWLSGLREENVSVKLPRFELKDARIALVDDLKALGMKAAFEAKAADFSAMSKPVSKNDELYISKAFHEAFIKVDEKGTEAAAATAVVMATRAMAAPVKTINFHVDHPFVFAIRDVKTGAILFLGRVVNPA